MGTHPLPSLLVRVFILYIWIFQWLLVCLLHQMHRSQATGKITCKRMCLLSTPGLWPNSETQFLDLRTNHPSGKASSWYTFRLWFKSLLKYPASLTWPPEKLVAGLYCSTLRRVDRKTCLKKNTRVVVTCLWACKVNKTFKFFSVFRVPCSVPDAGH